MSNVKATIGAVSNNPVTIELASDPNWGKYEQNVSLPSVVGQFEVRAVNEQGNKKSYDLMPMA